MRSYHFAHATIEQFHCKQLICVVKLQAQHALTSRVQRVFFVWHLVSLYVESYGLLAVMMPPLRPCLFY